MRGIFQSVELHLGMKLLFGCVSLNFEWPLNPCNRRRGKGGKIFKISFGGDIVTNVYGGLNYYSVPLQIVIVSTEHSGVSVVGYENENTEQFLLV